MIRQCTTPPDDPREFADLMMIANPNSPACVRRLTGSLLLIRSSSSSSASRCRCTASVYTAYSISLMLFSEASQQRRAQLWISQLLMAQTPPTPRGTARRLPVVARG